MMTSSLSPVVSSTSSRTVTFSFTSTKRTVPDFSLMTALLYGSHSNSTCSALTAWPSVTNTCAPYGTL